MTFLSFFFVLWYGASVFLKIKGTLFKENRNRAINRNVNTNRIQPRKNQKNIQIYSTKDINSENHFQIIGEVNAENSNTEVETTCFVKQEFKRYNLPYILYVLFFTFVLFIASIIVLVIISHKKTPW